MSSTIEKITFRDRVIAIIIRSNYQREGIEFFTPDNFSQQLAYMNRPKNFLIEAHVHNPVKREVQYTQEVLFIRSGKVRVDFYNDDQAYLESRILNGGDLILLSDGGHGLEMLEDTEIIEVKQGPYSGDKDKTRFDPVDSSEINIEGK